MIITKLFIKDNTKKRVFNFGQPQTSAPAPQALSLNTQSDQPQKYEGIGKGETDCLILSGSNEVSVENCVCKLQDFSGVLNAKNSQIYIVSTDACKISCVNSSVDITNKFKGTLNARKSLITIDPFFGSVDQESTIDVKLMSAYSGYFESVTADQSSVLDICAPELPTEDIFESASLTMSQVRSLSALPTLTLSENEMIIRVGERYLHIVLSGTKVKRVKSTQEVFKSDTGSLLDVSGQVIAVNS